MISADAISPDGWWWLKFSLTKIIIDTQSIILVKQNGDYEKMKIRYQNNRKKKKKYQGINRLRE